MQQRKRLPCHKISVKCVTTSCVGVVICVKMNIKLQDMMSSYLNYLFRPQKMQFVLSIALSL